MNLYHELCGCVRIWLSHTQLRRPRRIRCRREATPHCPPVEPTRPQEVRGRDRHPRPSRCRLTEVGVGPLSGDAPPSLPRRVSRGTESVVRGERRLIRGRLASHMSCRPVPTESYLSAGRNGSGGLSDRHGGPLRSPAVPVRPTWDGVAVL